MRAALVVSAAVLFAACAPARTVSPSAAGGSLGMGEGPVVVHLRGGPVAARALHVARDTTTWIDPATGVLGRAATADVLAVERRDRGRGAGRGALVAGVVAAVVTSVAMSLSDDGLADLGEVLGGGLGRHAAVYVGGASAGALAALPGALVGHAVGVCDRVEVAPVGAGRTP